MNHVIHAYIMNAVHRPNSVRLTNISPCVCDTITFCTDIYIAQYITQKLAVIDNIYFRQAHSATMVCVCECVRVCALRVVVFAR